MKRTVFIMCLVGMCLSLAACGSQGGETGSEQVNSMSSGFSMNDIQKDTDTSNPGRIEHVTVTIGESDTFTKKEIEAAIEVIKEDFKNHFQGCELNEIRYENRFDALDDYVSYKEDHNGKKIDKENVIRLRTDFTVDEKGADPALNAGSKYTYSCILIRDHKNSGWKIDNYGQG